MRRRCPSRPDRPRRHHRIRTSRRATSGSARKKALRRNGARSQPMNQGARLQAASVVASRLAIRTLHSRALGVEIQRVLADLESALAGNPGLALLDLGIEEFLDTA